MINLQGPKVVTVALNEVWMPLISVVASLMSLVRVLIAAWPKFLAVVDKPPAAPVVAAAMPFSAVTRAAAMSV